MKQFLNNSRDRTGGDKTIRGWTVRDRTGGARSLETGPVETRPLETGPVGTGPVGTGTQYGRDQVTGVFQPRPKTFLLGEVILLT